MKKTSILLALTILSVPVAGAKNLSINSQDYEVDTIVYKHQVGPGTTYAYYRLPQRPLEIHVLEVDLNNPYIHVEMCNGGDAAVACETPSHMYARHDAPGHDMVAATNGDFYTTAVGEVGLSRMGLFAAGECIFNPTGQSLFVIDGDGTPWCDYVNFAGTVSHDGETTRLHTVNQLRLEWETSTAADQLSLFTPAFGTNMHYSSAGGTIAVIRPKAGSATFPANTALSYIIETVGDNPGQAAIPEDGAVLYGVGASSTFLRSLSAGDEITLYLGTSLPSYPDVNTIREAMGGSGHIILRNGEITNINNPDVHPRTFMGISQDRKTIYSVAIDGRWTQSAGIDLDDEGRVLKWLGAWDGINLDGGGSTCMVVNGKIRNHNSDGTERAVGNGVLYYSTAPVDETISSLAFEPRAYFVPITASFRPAIYGYNQYGLLKTQDLEDVTLSCDPEIGIINENGEFVATDHEAVGNIYAEYKGIRCSQQVMTTMAPLSLDYDNYIIDDRRDYPIRMSAPVGRFTYGVDPGSVEWTIENPEICSISAGKVRGKQNGSTSISGQSKNFAGTITVTTENVEGNTRALDPSFDPNEWSIKQTGGTGITMSPYQQGWQLDYTGNGTARGAGITLSNAEKLRTYGLPDALSISIDPGDAIVSQITMTYTDNHGGHGTFYICRDQLPANRLSDITASFDEIIDTDDNSCYPLTFSIMKLMMGVSEKNVEYSIKMPSVQFLYGSAGIADQTVEYDGELIMTPNPVDAGTSVNVSTQDLVSVYDINGKKRLTAREQIDTTGLSRGVYIVRSQSASAKLMIR